MASIERRDTTRGPVWRVRYRLNRRQRVLTFATEDGARGFISLGQAVGWQHATDALAGARDTTDVPTVTAWVSHHIDSLSGITSGTRSTYRSYLDKSVAPFFEALPVTAVDDTLAASWVSWMADTQHLGGKSIRNRHALLSAALTSAVKAGLIPDNKIRGQRLPSTIQQETTFLQPADVDTLLAAIPQHYQLMVTVMVATGLRFGEITALQVRHITRDNGLRVTQAWKVTGKGGQRELGVPKSKKSIRTVAVPAALMPRIHAHVAGKKPGDLIFTNTTGGAIRQATFYTRVWAPAVSVLAGDTTEQVMDLARGRNETRIITRGPGPRPRVHDLRHTFASWAIQSGTPLPVIQRQLGHESITTTVDRYGHLARADFDAMAARISVNLPGAGAPALAPGSSAPRSATLPQPQG